MTFIKISFTVANSAFKSGFLVFCSHVKNEKKSNAKTSITRIQ